MASSLPISWTFVGSSRIREILAEYRSDEQSLRWRQIHLAYFTAGGSRAPPRARLSEWREPLDAIELQLDEQPVESRLRSGELKFKIRSSSIGWRELPRSFRMDVQNGGPSS
jgi:hypothetical protein